MQLERRCGTRIVYKSSPTFSGTSCSREVCGVSSATNAQQNFHMSIVFLENVELFEATINIFAYIIPGVGRIMLLKIGVTIREVPESS